jgi:hypothetical protein
VPFYPANQPVTVSTTVRNASTGALADPGDISLQLQDPLGAVVTYDYNPGAIVRDGTGAFHLDLSGLTPGYHYQGRWITTGTNAGAVEDPVFDITVSFYPALVSLADVKSPAVLDIPAAETRFDDELRQYIAQATEQVELVIGSPVITRQVTESPVRAAGDALLMSTTNVQSVTSVTSLRDGTVAWLAGTWAEFGPVPGMLHRAYGTWYGGPFSVVMQAGVGTGVPAGVAGAAKMIVQRLWETQHAPSNAPGEEGFETPRTFLGAVVVPPAAEKLLAPYGAGFPAIA